MRYGKDKRLDARQWKKNRHSSCDSYCGCNSHTLFCGGKAWQWGLESAYSAGVNETVSPKPQKDYYVGGSSIGGVDKNTKISTGDTIKKTDE